MTRPLSALHPPDCPKHHCHASACGAHIKPEMLMCARHWRMAPPPKPSSGASTRRTAPASATTSNHRQNGTRRRISRSALWPILSGRISLRRIGANARRRLPHDQRDGMADRAHS